MGLYSSWASIVLISVFDWACISFSKGWGSIQEWASICADTVYSTTYSQLKLQKPRDEKCCGSETSTSHDSLQWLLQNVEPE